MGFIIVARNPRNRKLIVVTEGAEHDAVTELSTEGEAHKVAKYVVVCKAWGYQVLEVD